MAEKFYFGVPGAIEEIRAPESGMTFGNNNDTEVTQLINGHRSVFSAPLTYKTYSMSWKAGSASLQHLIDAYNGQFGRGPFYLTDPTATAANVLPARWANCWQLAHQSNGWGKPVVNDWPMPTVPSASSPRVNKRVKFTQAISGSNVLLEGVLKMRTIRVPGSSYFLSCYGTATGGAGIKVRGFNQTTQAWEAITTFVTFTGLPVKVLDSTNTTYTMLELDIYLPLGSTLLLYGMALGTVDPTTLPTDYMPRGKGVGALKFTNTLNGNLTSKAVDRIGLSVDLMEVQNVESRAF